MDRGRIGEWDLFRGGRDGGALGSCRERGAVHVGLLSVCSGCQALERADSDRTCGVQRRRVASDMKCTEAGCAGDGSGA